MVDVLLTLLSKRRVIALILCILPVVVFGDIKWIPAGSLQARQMLKTNDGEIVRIVSIEKKIGQKSMYNLTVNHDHDFFIGDVVARILVHNCGPKTFSSLPPEVIEQIAGRLPLGDRISLIKAKPNITIMLGLRTFMFNTKKLYMDFSKDFDALVADVNSDSLGIEEGYARFYPSDEAAYLRLVEGEYGNVSFALKKRTGILGLFKRFRYVSGGKPGTMRDTKLNIIFRKNISAILSELNRVPYISGSMMPEGIIATSWRDPRAIALVNELRVAVKALKPFTIIPEGT